MTSMLLNLKFLVLVFHLLCQQLVIQLMASSLTNFLYLAPRIPPPPGFLSASLATPSQSPLPIPPNLSRAEEGAVLFSLFLAALGFLAARGLSL